PGLLLRSERDGFARAGRAAVCVDCARDGALRRLDYAAAVGRAVVREAGAIVLAQRPGILPGAEHGTGAAAARRVAGGRLPGFLLVEAAEGVRGTRRLVGQPDSGLERHVGGV